MYIYIILYIFQKSIYYTDHPIFRPLSPLSSILWCRYGTCWATVRLHPGKTKAFPHLCCMIIYCTVIIMEVDTWHWQGWFPLSCLSLKIRLARAEIQIFVWWCFDPTELGPGRLDVGGSAKWRVVPASDGLKPWSRWGVMGRRKGCRGCQLSGCGSWNQVDVGDILGLRSRASAWAIMKLLGIQITRLCKWHQGQTTSKDPPPGEDM